MKFLDKQGLSFLWSLITNKLNKKVDKVEGKDLVAIDTNLTQSGQAADAKVVGDALAEKQPIGDYALKSDVVQSDWDQNDESATDYVKNRTHYEAGPDFDITWDGEIGDRLVLDMLPFGFVEGTYLVKMDDRIFTLEELIGSTLIISDVASYNINAENCDAYSFPGTLNVNYFIAVIFDAEQLSTALGIPSGTITNGTYFSKDTTRFTGRDNSKKLDVEKYLPEGYPYQLTSKLNIIWDGNMEGRTIMDMTSLGYEGVYFVKVSDQVFSIDEIIGTEYLLALITNSILPVTVSIASIM